MKKLYMLLTVVLITVIVGCSSSNSILPSSAKAITAFTFPTSTGTTITEAMHTIAVTVPYGTVVTALVPTITHTGASISPNTGEAHDFSTPQTYTVTAADASTQDYVVTVTVALNPAKAITVFTFPTSTSTTIDEGAHTIAITVPLGTDVTTLVPTITHTGVSINPASGVANDFSIAKTYTVTAADDTTQAYVVTVTGNTLAMVTVPAGSFQRDATSTNISTITTAFRMSQYEITRAQFLAIMDVDPSDTEYSTGMTDPVQKVNWYHAIAFCNKLSIAEGFTPVYDVGGLTNQDWVDLAFSSIPTSDNATWNAVTATWTNTGYRLPTEMEWMWAAMGATSGSGYSSPTYLTGYAKLFAGSNATNAAGDNGTTVIGDYAWTYGNSSDGTKAVGTTGGAPGHANELGLYDMSGNVLEWVWDWWDNYPTGTKTDYRGAASDAYPYPKRVSRGGSWGNNAFSARVAFRYSTDPYEVSRDIGFRVVRP